MELFVDGGAHFFQFFFVALVQLAQPFLNDSAHRLQLFFVEAADVRQLVGKGREALRLLAADLFDARRLSLAELRQLRGKCLKALALEIADLLDALRLRVAECADPASLLSPRFCRRLALFFAHRAKVVVEPGLRLVKPYLNLLQPRKQLPRRLLHRTRAFAEAGERHNDIYARKQGGCPIPINTGIINTHLPFICRYYKLFRRRPPFA